MIGISDYEMNNFNKEELKEKMMKEYGSYIYTAEKEIEVLNYILDSKKFKSDGSDLNAVKGLSRLEFDVYKFMWEGTMFRVYYQEDKDPIKVRRLIKISLPDNPSEREIINGICEQIKKSQKNKKDFEINYESKIDEFLEAFENLLKVFNSLWSEKTNCANSELDYMFKELMNKYFGDISY